MLLLPTRLGTYTAEGRDIFIAQLQVYIPDNQEISPRAEGNQSEVTFNQSLAQNQVPSFGNRQITRQQCT